MVCCQEVDTCANNHHDLLLDILLIARNVLIINTNWGDKMNKVTKSNKKVTKSRGKVTKSKTLTLDLDTLTPT